MASMDSQSHRPAAIRVQLGPTLHAPERRSTSGLLRPALEGLVLGVAAGFAVGAHVLPWSLAVFLLGALALAYALVGFLAERP